MVRHQSNQIDRSPFVIGGVPIEPQMKVQLLGVTLDSDLSMSSYVSKTISSCFYQLRRLKPIRRFDGGNQDTDQCTSLFPL